MTWKDVGKLIVGSAPKVAGALGGPGSLAVGKVLARQLAAPATPEGVALLLSDHSESLDVKQSIAMLEDTFTASEAVALRDSQSTSAYVRRWRPTLGYVAAACFGLKSLIIAYAVVLRPEVIGSLSELMTASLPLWTMLFAVVGAGAVGRSFEKTKHGGGM